MQDFARTQKPQPCNPSECSGGAGCHIPVSPQAVKHDGSALGEMNFAHAQRCLSRAESRFRDDTLAQANTLGSNFSNSSWRRKQNTSQARQATTHRSQLKMNLRILCCVIFWFACVFSTVHDPKVSHLCPYLHENLGRQCFHSFVPSFQIFIGCLCSNNTEFNLKQLSDS